MSNLSLQAAHARASESDASPEGLPHLLITHRLDVWTSGILVLGRTPAFVAAFNRLLQAHSLGHSSGSGSGGGVRKLYRALSQHRPPEGQLLVCGCRLTHEPCCSILCSILLRVLCLNSAYDAPVIQCSTCCNLSLFSDMLHLSPKPLCHSQWYNSQLVCLNRLSQPSSSLTRADSAKAWQLARPPTPRKQSQAVQSLLACLLPGSPARFAPAGCMHCRLFRTCTTKIDTPGTVVWQTRPSWSGRGASPILVWGMSEESCTTLQA